LVSAGEKETIYMDACSRVTGATVPYRLRHCKTAL